MVELARALKRGIGWSESHPSRGFAGFVRFVVKVLLLRLQPHQYLRYAPVVGYLRACERQARDLRVLEVGSGSVGVTRFWSHPVTGVDISFDGARLPYLEQVAASAVRLPFPDRSFDTVLSLDVLEHLCVADREQAVREMLRVATSGVLIGVPCAPEAEAAEGWGRRRLASALQSARDGSRHCRELERRGAYLHEHRSLGLPTEDAILSVIVGSDERRISKVDVFGNESVSAWKFLLPSVVPLRPWSRWARRVLGLLALPVLLRSRGGGFYRRFFFIRLSDGVSADADAAGE